MRYQSISLGMLFSVLLFVATSQNGVAKPSGFELNRLPVGANVTLVQPATTFVHLSESIGLTATDLPQTISLTPISMSSRKAKPFRVAIYDKNLDSVKYATLKPGAKFLYTLTSYERISIVPQMSSIAVQNTKYMRLQVESDKPLDVAR